MGINNKVAEKEGATKLKKTKPVENFQLQIQINEALELVEEIYRDLNTVSFRKSLSNLSYHYTTSGLAPISTNIS